MNKVFITGLANKYFCSDCGREEGNDEIPALGNFNFIPVLEKPEMILWIDKLVISKNVYSIISKEKLHSTEEQLAHIFLEYFEKNNLIEVLDTEALLTRDVMKAIEKEINNDLQALADRNISGLTFASCEDPRGLEEPFILQIGDSPFCPVHLTSLYVDLFLAEKSKTNGLFTPREMSYCNYKFGLTRKNPANISDLNEGIDKVFSLHVPYDFSYTRAISSQLFGQLDQKCERCFNLSHCEKNNIDEIKDYLSKLSEWRTYDECEKLRGFINKLADEAIKNNNSPMSTELVNNYNDEARRINKTIHKVLPKIKNFFNVLTAVSIPLAVGSLLSGYHSLSIASGLVTATKSGVDLITKSYESKYKWLGFKIEDLERKVID